MKKIYFSILILFISASAFSQNPKKAGDRFFAQRAFIDAIEAYERIPDKDQEVLQNLGDAYFYTHRMERAVEMYHLLFDRHESTITPDYAFRFAHALRAMGAHEDADYYMSGYSGEDYDFDHFQRELDTLAAHVYTTDQVISNSASADFGITYWRDRVVFASTRNENRPLYPWNKKPTLDLYSAHMDSNGEMGDITPFSDQINTDQHESSATFNADGTVMYFDRTNDKRVKNEEGVKIGHISIYRAELVDGQWTNVEPLPFTSEDYSTEHPSLSPDGSKLYFASDMPGTTGSFDLYMVSVHEDGSYGTPENLGPGINTPHREQFPYIAENGTLYFASDGHPGFGNLDLFRSEGDFSQAQNLGASVNSGGDEFAFVLKPGEERGWVASNRRGSDNLYVFTRETNEPPVVEYEERETNPETGRQQLRDVSNIHFDFDKATIKEESKPILNRVVEILKKYPDLQLEIGAHTDAHGPESYNQELSERRAAATLEYILSQGIEESRLTSKGYGESMPLNDCTEPTGCTDEQYARNRRSEFTIVDQNEPDPDFD